MKYFRLWTTNEQHAAYTGSTKYVEPYVGVSLASNDVFYNRTPLTGMSVGSILYDDGFYAQTVDDIAYDPDRVPIAICVIPEGFLPDEDGHASKARVMSLVYVHTGATSGSTGTTNAAMQWCTVNGIDTPLKNYTTVNTVDPYASGSYDGTTIGSAGNAFLASPYFNRGGLRNLVDSYSATTWYYTHDEMTANTCYYAASPFMKDPVTGKEVLCSVYADTGNTTNCLSDFNGKGNTAVLHSISVTGSAYTAADSCHIFCPKDCTRIPTNSWYLPAEGELAFIVSRFTQLNASLNKLRTVGWSAYASSLAATSFWSSTEYNGTNARCVYAGNGYVGNNTKASTRCVRAFAQV